jgi:hypothetical protein
VDKNRPGVNVSMPNLNSRDRSKQGRPFGVKEGIGRFMNKIPAEENSIENEIYPAPENFREKDHASMHDLDASTEDGEVKKTMSKRKEDQIDYLNELNKELQEELKQTFTPRGTLAGI